MLDVLHHPPPSNADALLTSVTLGDLTTPRTGEPMGKDELTPTEVAREFNVSPATVRRWELAGILAPSRRLPGSRHRRYSRTSVDALKVKLNEDQPEAGHEG